MSYELYVEPEALDELKRLARRYKPAVVSCTKIGSVIVQSHTFASEIVHGHHTVTLVETVVNNTVWHHAIPDTVFGSGAPLLDVRVLIASHAASLFHVTCPFHVVGDVADAPAPQQTGPGDDRVQAVARSLIDRGNDDAS